MGYASQAGRARTDASNPQAHAICDRCGFRYNHVDLRWQFEDPQTLCLSFRLPAGSYATGLLRAAGGRPEDALQLAAQGLTAKAWSGLPKAIARGDASALADAGPTALIATLQKRQGLMVACPEEIAYRQGWITATQVENLAKPLAKNSYGQYLLKILNSNY